MGELKPRRFLFITHPRSCSNLLVRILALESQPGIVSGDDHGGYFFMPLMLLMKSLGSYSRSVDDWSDEEARQVRDCAQACFDELRRYAESAETRGCSVFVKEHCQFFVEPTAVNRQLFGSNVRQRAWTVDDGDDEGRTRSSFNHTLMPDKFLLTWLPIFLIRHPALAFPSVFRSIGHLDGEGPLERSRDRYMTLESTRALYDLYAEKRRSGEDDEDDRDGNAAWPVVIDADDVIASPAVVVRLCERLRLDPGKLRFQWAPVPAEDVAGRRDGIMRSTLYRSSGIETSKSAGGIVIEDEARKWRAEFGVETSERIEGLVRAAMPDYEYLRERRLRAD